MAHNTVRRQLTKHKKQITPWGLLDNSSQGEAIGFAQFMVRIFYRDISESFSDFLGLIANRLRFVLPCPLDAIGVWVRVWVS